VNDMRDEPSQTKENSGKLNPLQIVGSVLAAGLGVQSSTNRERDFQQGRPGAFIAAGIVLTLLFIGALAFAVQMIVKSTGD